MAMEVMEDDVLFADLSKQIALLIMDDDEEEEEFSAQSPPVQAQGFHHLPQAILMPPAVVPYTYDMGYRRDQSKGTGVFIPRSSIPRRKNRSSGKSTSNNSQRHSNDHKSGVPAAAASHVASRSNSRLHSNCYTNSDALKNRA